MISYYELLGMIKEDKAPRKIRVHLTSGISKLYVREDDMDGTFNFYGLGVNEKENEEYHFYLAECFLESDMFEKNIEILDEKKIEKLYTYRCYTDFIYHDEKKDDKERFLKDLQNTFVDIEEKINEIIDYLKSKGDE